MEIHKQWNLDAAREIDLKAYTQVKSTNSAGGYKIKLSTPNNENPDIISLIAPYNNIAPFSNDAKQPKRVKVGKRTINKQPRSYPTDELFA